MRGALVIVTIVFYVTSTHGQTTESAVSGSLTSILTPICPDFCTLPVEPGGRGKAPFRRWYFDTEEKECKRFRYTGRNGNQNRFWKKSDCESNCKNCDLNSSSGEDETQQIDACSLPISKGTACKDSQDAGNQLRIMWGYNLDKESCEPFAYFGCNGNENNFDSKSKCESHCLVGD